MKATLPYPPTINLFWRVVNGRPIISGDGRGYKIRAGLMARQAGMRPLAGPLSVKIDVYRPRKIGDLDNTLKVLLDSLRGIAFEDDKQVVQIIANRFDDKANPRAEVEISEIERREA